MAMARSFHARSGTLFTVTSLYGPLGDILIGIAWKRRDHVLATVVASTEKSIDLGEYQGPRICDLMTQVMCVNFAYLFLCREFLASELGRLQGEVCPRLRTAQAFRTIPGIAFRSSTLITFQAPTVVLKLDRH